MLREEIRIVKRRLEDYTSYKYLALEADKKALATQVLIEEAGQPKSPGWNKAAPTQNHLELSGIINELISDQEEYERDAKEYHEKMRHIEEYIHNNYTGAVARIMDLHYLEGKSYEDLEEEIFISVSGMSAAVTRAMMGVDFSCAKAII